jgi:hypothetical protein
LRKRRIEYCRERGILVVGVVGFHVEWKTKVADLGARGIQYKCITLNECLYLFLGQSYFSDFLEKFTTPVVSPKHKHGQI